MYYKQAEQEVRRQLWLSTIRDNVKMFFNPAGSGVIPLLDLPWREPLWILSAFYTVDREHIDLANKVLDQYNSGPEVEYKKLGQHSGRVGIFKSNITAVLCHSFGHLMTPEPVAVAQRNCNVLFRIFAGSAQLDYKFINSFFHVGSFSKNAVQIFALEKYSELVEFATLMMNSFVKVIIVFLPTHCNLSVLKLKFGNRLKRVRDKLWTQVDGIPCNNIGYELCQYSF